MSKKIKLDNSSLNTYLQMYQNIIDRMARNSATSKALCVTIISAILFFLTKNKGIEHSLITLVPVGLFFILDTYYLALEISFRDSYNELVEKINNKALKESEYFILKPKGEILEQYIKAMFSISTTPFYLIISIIIVTIYYKFQ